MPQRAPLTWPQRATPSGYRASLLTDTCMVPSPENRSTQWKLADMSKNDGGAVGKLMKSWDFWDYVWDLYINENLLLFFQPCCKAVQ